MPRNIQQVRFNWLVPEQTINRMQTLAETEEVATAELVRRIGDMLLTLDVTKSMNAPGMGLDDTIKRFTIYMSPWMLDKLTMVSLSKLLTVHEYLRQGSEIYLRFKRSDSYKIRLGMITPGSTIPLTNQPELL